MYFYSHVQIVSYKIQHDYSNTWVMQYSTLVKYNSHMAGIDLCDMLFSMYQLREHGFNIPKTEHDFKASTNSTHIQFFQLSSPSPLVEFNTIL